jgi:hypothetical protein
LAGFEKSVTGSLENGLVCAFSGSAIVLVMGV